MTVYVHPHTQDALEAAVRHDVHALIMTGETGVGLLTVAQEYARKARQIVQVVLPEKDEKIDVDKGSITIQIIRRLYDQTKTKEPKGRIIIIDSAERMGIPAQNAFLKLLEEPVEGTRFILLTHQLNMLLPTIQSRAQQITVKPITEAQSIALLDELGVKDSTKRTQLLFIAAGLPAELARLVKDDTYFSQRAQIVKDARQFITGTPYDRLTLASKYKNDRTAALVLVADAAKMVRNSLASGASQSTIQALERLENLHQRITDQGNVRLQLSAAAIL